MPIALTDLIATRTREQYRAQLLAAMQGVGHTQHTIGSGLGAITGSGVSTLTATLVVRVIASGGLGVGTFQYSTDGGVTFSGTLTIPAGGTYTVPSSGVTLAFDASNAASVINPYVAGDQYAIALSVTSIPVTAWQPGSTALTLLEADADVLSDLSQLQQLVARGGLTGYATGAWLDVLALNFYKLTRTLATQTQGLVTLTAVGGVGPYTITPGQLILATVNGVQFSNTNGGVLSGGGTLQLAVQATSAGAAGNVGNSTIVQMLTPLAGVTVSNPNPGSGTWITTYGNDDESDSALVQRCKNRWPALGIGQTAAQYDLWARAASANVAKTNIYADPIIGGQVDVVLAGTSGPVAGADVTAVLNYIQARVSLTNAVSVVSATGVPVNVTATVYVSAASLALAQQQCPANVQALIASIPIGGTVWLSEVITALSSPVGVSHVVVTLPAADLALTAAQVATLTGPTLTYVTV